MNAFSRGFFGAVAGTLVVTGGAQFVQSGPPIVYRTFDSGAVSALVQPGLRVLNNEAEFQRYWAQHTGSAANAPKGIEWGKELLLAINLGQRRTAGYQVYVEGIDRPKPNDILVRYVEVQPPTGAALAQMMTSPWVLVRMERSGGNIRFQGRVMKARYQPFPPPACNCRCACATCSCGRQSADR